MELERLERKDKRLILACLSVAAVSLYIGVRYFFQAFPEASIEFRVTRSSSLPLAEGFLKRMGLDSSAFRHAAIFDFDDQQKTFLERELGVAESNKVLDTTVRLWRWRHRWFRPLEKEEIEVDVTTRGEPVGFHHLLSEEAEGESLDPGAARTVAESFLESAMERRLDELTFVEASLEERPHRVDHTFTWKLARFDVEGADYRLVVGVAGGEIASYSEYLKVPDTWVRDYEKLRSKNEITGVVDSVLLLLTVLAMLVFLVRRIQRGDVRYRVAAILGGVTFVLLSLSQLNSIPSTLFGYDTNTSFGNFVLRTLFLALLQGFGGAVAIFLITVSAEPFYRERFPGHLSLSSILRLRAFRTKEFFVASLVGITLTFFFFAYENV